MSVKLFGSGILALAVGLLVSNCASTGDPNVDEPMPVAARPENSTAVITVSTGIPAFVNASVDLAAHEAGPEKSWSDAIYVAARVTSGERKFGILVVVSSPRQGNPVLIVAVTDEVSGWHKKYESVIPRDEFQWDTTGLSIKAPGLIWSGNANHMAIAITTPWGALDADLVARGPSLNYAGTGYFLLLGAPIHEFALPAMSITGALTIDGKGYPISGESWLDRQWGAIPDLSRGRWCWGNLSMPNGDKIVIWDTVIGNTEEAWATVLHPDGSYVLGAITPLAKDKPWTSPASGQTYPTRWRFAIPSLDSYLTVAVTGPLDQELPLHPFYEGTAAFSGTYRGRKVTGLTYMEMIGNWTAQ